MKKLNKRIGRKMVTFVLAILIMSTIAILSAGATNEGTFSLTNATGNAGEEVKVFLNCSDNPGITAWKLDFTYNSNALELIEYNANGVYSNVKPSESITENPFTLSWEDGSKDVTVNGMMAELTFKIKPDAPSGDYEINLSYDEANIYSIQKDELGVEINVPFVPINGVITVNGKEEHNLTCVPAKNATCTEDGNTAYYVCNDCGKWFEDENATVEITDHSSVVIKAAHTSSDWIIDKEATESETGSMHRECTVCKEILETKEIPVITPVQPTTKATNPTDTPSQDTTTAPATTSGNNATSSDKKATPDSISNGAIATGAISATFIVSLIAVIAFAGIYIFSIKRKKMMNK